MAGRSLSGLAFLAFAAGACRGAWDLGDPPDRLADDGAAGARAETSSGGDAGGSSPGATSTATGGGAASAGGGGQAAGGGDSSSSGPGGGGGEGGSGPTGCGACFEDGDCGNVEGEGRCGTDGTCARAAWLLATNANGVADGFAVTDARVAVIIDAGSIDRDDAPGSDNLLAVLDRTTGTLSAAPLDLTARGSLAASPSGVLAFAPRAPDADGHTQLVMLDPSGNATPWPGAPDDVVLGGLRWSDETPGGGAFFAVAADVDGTRFVRFGEGSFTACAASGELPPSRVWAGDGTARIFATDVEAPRVDLSRLEIGATGCGAAVPVTTGVDLETSGRPVALAVANGYTTVLLDTFGGSRLVMVDEANEVWLNESTTATGHALAAREGFFYAMRDGRLSRFGAADPESTTPVADFTEADEVVDLALADDAIFAITLGSNGEARGVCVGAP